jgi:hypothetical protein
MPLLVLVAELSWFVDRRHGVCPAGSHRSGTVAVLDNARTPTMASAAGPRPACGVHPSGSVVRGPAVRPSGVRPVRCPVTGFVVRDPASGRLVSGPSGVRPAGVRPIRPSGRVRLVPPAGGGIGDRPRRQDNPHHGNGPRSLGAAGSSSSSGRRPSRPGRGRRRRVTHGRRGCRWWTRAGSGAGRRPRLPLASRAGQAGVPGRPSPAAARGHGRRPQREVAAPAARLPSSDGWATTVGGCRGACRPRERAGRGRWGCRRGWACGPSAAQAGSERSRLAAGSALSCDDGWWACQDLNLGPHPYQQSGAYRYATLRFCRSRATVGGEVMRSLRLRSKRCKQARLLYVLRPGIQNRGGPRALSSEGLSGASTFRSSFGR